MLVKYQQFVTVLDEKMNRIRGEIIRTEQGLQQSIYKLNTLKSEFENYTALINKCTLSGIVSRSSISEKQRVMAVLISKQDAVYQEMLTWRSRIVEQQDALQKRRREVLTINKRKYKIEFVIKKIKHELSVKQQNLVDNETEEQVACGY